MNQLIKIDSCTLTIDKKSFTKLFLYGDGRNDRKTNISIYFSKRFDGQLI